MKKLLLSMLVIGAVYTNSYAQPIGGLPWSYETKNQGFFLSSPKIAFPALNMELIEEEDKADQVSLVAKPMRIAYPVDADINLLNSGKITYLDNGNIIWSAQISIPGALTIDAYFDAFNLPKGAKLFFYNKNGRQVDGAYTSEHINEFNTFRSNYVQGDLINIELNLPAGTKIEDVQFHINSFGAAYRGGVPAQIAKTYGLDEGMIPTDATASGDDPCHTNANCDGWGTKYYNLKQTAVHLDMGGFVCSGNLINNTAKDCKPLLLTASHCQNSSSFSNSTFANWRFYFNYEVAECVTNANANVNDFSTGATFKSRSVMPWPGQNSGPLKADHLLLQLNGSLNVLSQFDLYLGGWDRSGANALNDTIWIGFHHPGGYRKKVSVTRELSANGTFNQSATTNTHWAVGDWFLGGTQGGSSGSALFDLERGRIIGPLTGGPVASGSGNCPELKRSGALYAKLSRAWENANGGEGGSTDSTRLRNYLDPINSGDTFMNTMKLTNKDCGADYPDDVSVNNIEFQNSIHVYPNPSSGLVFVKFNFASSKELKIQVLNLLGQVVGAYNYANARTNEATLDLSTYANGIYMIQLNDGTHTATSKIIINK